MSIAGTATASPARRTPRSLSSLWRRWWLVGEIRTRRHNEILLAWRASVADRGLFVAEFGREPLLITVGDQHELIFVACNAAARGAAL